jgi:hypothetical protein
MQCRIVLLVILLFAVSSLVMVVSAYAHTTIHYGPYGNVNPAAFDLTVYSPDSQTVYADTMLLKFNITWTEFVDFPFSIGPSLKGDYAYSIDDGPRISIESNQSIVDQLYTLPAGNFTINPSFSYSLNISSLENGSHKIVIIAGQYRHSDYYYINQTCVPIMFIVQNPTQITAQEPTTTPPTPSPKLTNTPSITPTNSPTQQPTLSPSPTADNNQAENFTSTIIIIVLVLVAIFVGLLSYFAKHKERR